LRGVARPGEESRAAAIAVQAIEALPSFGQLKPSRRYGSPVPQPLRRRCGGYRVRSTRAGADRAKKRKYARTDRRTTHQQRRPSADCVYAEIMPRSNCCSDHAEITVEIGEIGPIKLLNRWSLPSLVCDNADQTMQIGGNPARIGRSKTAMRRSRRRQADGASFAIASRPPSAGIQRMQGRVGDDSTLRCRRFKEQCDHEAYERRRHLREGELSEQERNGPDDHSSDGRSDRPEPL